MSRDHRVINQLVAIRKSKGLRQQDVADRIGIHRSTVGTFETQGKSHKSPLLDHVIRYADAIGARLEVRSTS